MTENPWALKRRKTLQPEEVQKILRAAESINLRDYTILMLIANLGLRVGEAVNLKYSDFDAERNTVRVFTLKQGEETIDELFVHTDIFALVTKFAEDEKCGKGLLFTGAGGSALSTRAVQKIYDRCAVLAGVETKTNKKGQRGRGVHSLRHFCAAQYVSAGADRATVAARMRHRSMKSTEAYFDTFNEQEWVKKIGIVK